jgi:hypothetical protein
MDTGNGVSGGLYSDRVGDLQRVLDGLTEATPQTAPEPAGAQPIARAVGFLLDDIDGADPAHDASTIRELADRYGYELTNIYTPAPHVKVPELWLLERVHVQRAAAVIVPGLAHLGGSVPASLPEVCSVVMPGHVMLGRNLYPGIPAGVAQ